MRGYGRAWTGRAKAEKGMDPQDDAEAGRRLDQRCFGKDLYGNGKAKMRDGTAKKGEATAWPAMVRNGNDMLSDGRE